MVRRLCQKALDDLGVAGSCVADIELAVTEACTNVLKHAHSTETSYDVTIAVHDAECYIRVIDSGAGFDHSTKGHEEALAGEEAGRGILLMRSLVDNLHFASIPDQGTIVHLHKHLDLTEGSILRQLTTA
jgi:serine/threonine-protein kinase RsbW